MIRHLILTITCAFAFFTSVAYANDHTAAKWKANEQGLYSLTFTATQMGKKFTGTFKDFDVDLFFSPDHLDTSSVTVNVQMISANSNDKERDQTIQKDEWFNSAVYPVATFKSDHFIQNPEINSQYKYIAKGTLTIAGVSKSIDLPFSFSQKQKDDGQGTSSVKGQVNLNRLDFGLGKKSWADEESISHNVLVKYELDLTAEK